MANFLDDEDDQVFQAALSFVNEFGLDDMEEKCDTMLAMTALEQHEEKLAVVSCCPNPAMTSIRPSLVIKPDYEKTPLSNTTLVKNQNSNLLKRKKGSLKDRKKLLRRAGIHEDANWMSKDIRLEIEYLQEKIEKLQLDLQVLQSRKTRPLSTQSKTHNSTDQCTRQLTSSIPRVWEEIASRQERRLVKTEHENGRLKLAVQDQQKRARHMLNLVQKRAGHLMSDCSYFMDRHSSNQQIIRGLKSNEDRAGDFLLLFRHLETAYQEVNNIFASNGLASMVLTSSNIHIREGVNGKYLEAFSNKVLPFTFRAAKEATWDHFKGSEKHLGNGTIYEKTAKHLDDPYTIMEEFTKEMHSKNARADIKAQQLVRRYMEVERDIVIWVSIAKPVEIQHKVLPGLTYHLRGYALTKRSVAATPENEMAQLQCVSLISFEPEAEARYGTETVRAVTKFLIVNAAQKMQAHQDRIENALVDRQLKRRGVLLCKDI